MYKVPIAYLVFNISYRLLLMSWSLDATASLYSGRAIEPSKSDWTESRYWKRLRFTL